MTGIAVRPTAAGSNGQVAIDYPPTRPAAILAGGMMLRHIGEGEATDRAESAVRLVLAERKFVTPDLGGHSSTAECANRVVTVLWTLCSESTLQH